MKTLRRLAPAILGVALLASTLSGCDWPEGTRYVHEVFSDYDVTTGLIYRSTTTNTGRPVDLKLDIYEPRGDSVAERPVVMWMFGGAWQAGDRDQLASYAQDAARRGYVGVTIDYRLWEGPGFDLLVASDNAYDDALAAIEWLKAHAADYRLDPDAVVAAGYSAGAVNALHAIYRPATSAAAGAVAIAGLSFTAPSADRPPSIVFSGTDDTVVPYAIARDQCDQSRQWGNVCRFVPYEGGNHLIAISQADDIRDRTADFIFEEVLLPLGYQAEQMQPAA